MEIGYPQIGTAGDGTQLVVIHQEMICEECLAGFDALYAMSQLDTKGVQH